MFTVISLVSQTTISLDFLTHKTVHISIEIAIWFFQTTNISIAQVLMLWIICILSYVRVHINWFDIRIILQWLGWVKPTPSIIILVCCGIIQVGLLIGIALICVSCWMIWNIFVASMNIYMIWESLWNFMLVMLESRLDSTLKLFLSFSSSIRFYGM